MRLAEVYDRSGCLFKIDWITDATRIWLEGFMGYKVRYATPTHTTGEVHYA